MDQEKAVFTRVETVQSSANSFVLFSMSGVPPQRLWWHRS